MWMNEYEQEINHTIGTTISSFLVLDKNVYESNPMLCVGLILKGKKEWQLSITMITTNNLNN